MASPARSRGRFIRPGQALALFLALVLVAGVGGVLAAGLALPAVAAAEGTTTMTVKAFDGLPTELEQKPLPQKSTILAADGKPLATFYDQNRVVVPLDQIAPIMQKAVISVEDKRFYEHAGIDVQGMARAAINTVVGQKEGASTLTQQYVKNVLIEAALAIPDPAQRAQALADARDNSGASGMARKLREAKLAITLEKTMTKDQILEKYLNIAQFGASSIYGVESAAEYFFGKHAKDLTYLEAATIAGITQSPTKWDPVLNPVDSQNRRDTVLDLMYQQGYITQAEHDKGAATPLKDTLHITPIKQGCMTANDSVAGSGFFCDYVTKVILHDPAFGKTQSDRQSLLYRGGLTITTTLLPDEQTAADQEVKAGVPVDDSSGIGSAIVSVEPGTGKITSMAQNRVYNPMEQHADRETALNFNTSFEYGGSSGFSPGSSYKAFTLLEWLRQGHALNEKINATPLQYNQSQFTSCNGRLAGVYKFSNSESNQNFPQTVLSATANSVNSAFIAMGLQLNLCNIVNGAADLGVLRAGDPNAKDSAGLAKGDVAFGAYPGNILGSEQTTPLMMAGAYAAFASGGTYCKPIAITSVTDATGAKLNVPSADCQQKVEPQYAAAMDYAMSNVWKGTAKAVGAPPFPAAGKTGTTTFNEELWFVGFTPLRATAVWSGQITEQQKTLHGETINGKTYYQGPFGSDISAPTWKRFMMRIMAGQNVPDFPAVGNDQLYGKQIGVPYVVGQPQDQATSTLQNAGFTVQVSPNQVASSVPAGSVASQSPTGTATPGSTVTLVISNGQPPDNQPAPGGGGGPGGGPGPGGGNNGPGGGGGNGHPNG